MILSSIFISDENFPILGTPLFSNTGDDRPYIQQSIDGVVLSSFEPIRRPPNDFLRIKGIGRVERVVGDPLLYSIAFKDGWYWIGESEKLSSDLTENPVYRSQLQKSPFLRLEIARILGDAEMLGLAAVDGARQLARIAPQVAASWREVSIFSAEIGAAIDAALGSARDQLPSNIAIRISLPQLAMESLDSAAQRFGDNRSSAIRQLLDLGRDEFDDINFWKAFRDFTYRMNNEIFLNKNFFDPELRSIILGGLIDSNHYIDKNVFYRISDMFSDSRATIRIRADDRQAMLIQYNEEFTLSFKGMEEFYGYFVLFLASKFHEEFDDLIRYSRDRLFEQVRVAFLKSAEK